MLAVGRGLLRYVPGNIGNDLMGQIWAQEWQSSLRRLHGSLWPRADRRHAVVRILEGNAGHHPVHVVGSRQCSRRAVTARVGRSTSGPERIGLGPSSYFELTGGPESRCSLREQNENARFAERTTTNNGLF